MKCFFILFSIVATIIVVFGNQYCRMHCKNNDHIGCKPKDFSQYRNCPRNNPEVMKMTPDLQTFLVDAHNEKRNIIAGGKNPKYNHACRMATMQWDNELAKLAEYNVKQCEMKHDHCHNTEAFKYSGQNLAISYRTSTLSTDQELLKSAVDSWYAEEANATQPYIDSFPTNYRGPKITHFTVMMVDRNIRLGCAAAVYYKNRKNRKNVKHFLTACNYAITNIENEPIYTTCNEGGENCKARNPRYPNLCRIGEKYDDNN